MIKFALQHSKTIRSLGILMAMLGMGAIVWLVMKLAEPAPLNARRIAERTRALADLQIQDKTALETYGWIDRQRGMVRLPIARAMQLSCELNKNPAAGRTNLISRANRLAGVVTNQGPP